MKSKCLLIILILTIFNLCGNTMYGAEHEKWKKPAFVEWKGPNILLGGIVLQEVQDFYIWSIDREQMLWYISLNGPRYKTYSKKSRSEITQLKYGIVPHGYIQKFPLEDKSLFPGVGETLKIYFCYTMDWYFGPRFETVNVYLRKTNEGYQKIELDVDNDLKNLEKINNFIKKYSIK